MSLDTILVVLGASVLVFALGSRVMGHVFLTPVLVSTLVGIVLGPRVLGLVEPSALGGDSAAVLREVARVTLAISVVAVGLQMTGRDVREGLPAVGRLLSLGMLGMWLVTAAGAALLFGLPMWPALLLGAVLTPTDPVVASTIVDAPLAKRNLPHSLRRNLQLESGANDGLALPFVLLAGLMLESPGAATAGEWATRALWELAIAAVVGLGLGFALGKLARIEFDRRETEPAHLIDAGIGLGLLALGATHWLGGSGVLAAFLAGVAFSAALAAEEREGIERAQSAVLNLMLVPTFILFGALLPWAEWREMGWAGMAFVAWVLLLRRPLAVVAALLHGGHGVDRRGVAWLGWFGPLGVAGIYYATYAERFTGGTGPGVFPAAALAIFASIVAHSLTATPGVHWYAGKDLLATLRHPLDPEEE